MPITRDEHIKRFNDIIDYLKDLHMRKNNNYAKDADPLSNLRQCEDFGIKATQGTMVRMSDKWSRLVQLMSGKKDLVGESLKETALDFAVYLILFAMLVDQENEQGKRV